MSAAALLYRAALGASLAVGLAGLGGWIARSTKAGRLVSSIGGGLALLVSLAAFALRWVEAGHLPLFGTYESALSVACAVAAAAWAWEWRSQFVAGVVPFCALVSAALLGQGLRYDPAAYALTISERSLVVDAHAVLAWSAFGLLATNAAVAVRLARRAGPADPEAEGWLFRTLELGFLLHSAMMASGSLYKFMLFGKAWSFDPVETLGFVAWISYGTLLHLKLMGGWKAERLARWCLLVFAVLVVSYRAIVLFPSWATYHVFDLALRVHLG